MKRRPHSRLAAETALTVALIMGIGAGLATMLIVLHLPLVETPIVDLRL